MDKSVRKSAQVLIDWLLDLTGYLIALRFKGNHMRTAEGLPKVGRTIWKSPFLDARWLLS